MTQSNATVTDLAEKGRVFELAAELFGVLATPMRLRILSALCDKEKSVSQLLQEIDTTQPNLSQHLNLLYRAGLVRKRREGVQIFYATADEHIVQICQTMCDRVLARRPARRMKDRPASS